ncbi:hypothetical protein M378DRAFT_400499 [Amanita muscaria Koide BX008]|uniref:Uncharacterized protein n=1 Tax=Amanita muscaria (strain Koide BX008) TaxID=946122 RepID=A0A0C2WKE7_AMAMK|nr:hypothetical protein M378DRAFT_400499 [Amanita muscaria Koide BX008]
MTSNSLVMYLWLLLEREKKSDGQSTWSLSGHPNGRSTLFLPLSGQPKRLDAHFPPDLSGCDHGCLA